MERVSPKHMMLNSLRTTKEPLPTSALVATGLLFDIPAGTTRVALNRLVARGLVENIDGRYRLTDAAAPMSRIVDDWRRGDKRIRKWNGRWLAMVVPRGTDRTPRAQAQRAMSYYGFHEGLSGLWVRPDNLAVSFDDLIGKLQELGLSETVEPMTVADVRAETAERWRRELWPARKLASTYATALAQLEKSAERLKDLPLEDGIVEAYHVGGRAITVLALDPLLPDEIVDGSGRRSLGRAALAYDRVAARIRRRYLDRLMPQRDRRRN